MELEGIMERLDRISKEIRKMRREVDEIEYTVYYETPEVMVIKKEYIQTYEKSELLGN